MSGPVLQAKFDNSGRYLASIFVSLDTHQIRVQSVNSSQTPINASFNLDKSSKVTNFNWIELNSTKTQHIAVCLNKGSILIYSPHTNDIVCELTTSSNVSLLDFHYSNFTQTAWSSDIDGNVCEWDMNSFSLLQSFKIGDFIESVVSIYQISSCIYLGEPHLLLAANSIYLFSLKTRKVVKTFPGHIQPIGCIACINEDMFITSAKGDRFINLYSLEKTTTKAIFVASTSVQSLAFGKLYEKSALIAINENGNLEVFNDFLGDAKFTPSSNALKKKRKQIGVSSRPSNSTIKISRPEAEIKNPQDSNIMINTVNVQDDNILFTWLESSNISYFDAIKWVDEVGNYLITSNKTVIKNKMEVKAHQGMSYGHDTAAPRLYNESHAIVNDGSNVRDLEKVVVDEEDDEEEEEAIAEKLERLAMKQQKNTSQRKRKLEDNKNGISLSVILSQSLTNNDHTLLETVLQNNDIKTIQNTISRLNPYLAVVLLDRLSEKIQRQASRFNQLNSWLKWILVIHGPVIASLPDLNTKLYSLHSVLAKKTDTLPRLLELKGRLNLVYDEMNLKSSIEQREKVNDEEEEEEVMVVEESDVEYVEDLDDAQFSGEVDIDVNERDDYLDSDEEEEEEGVGEEEEDDDDDDDDENIQSLDELDNNSDIEIN
ncbi:UTP5 [Candida oxycetoniae]|uniref:UTP5 n=1 Tax=Candida oxycetoniae TaxID=497107 RepID=A0AAI9X021_9ASCO|nr:UTP5 [Candida oxycetoniae]KAI3406967.2 UTP5 [Candida oxycetoniae]